MVQKSTLDANIMQTKNSPDFMVKLFFFNHYILRFVKLLFY